VNARRALVSAGGAVVLVLASRTAADAHRLDEYLQASRVSIDVDRVELEISLTPGASIADEAFGWIDRDRNGEISRSEGESYVREVLRDVTFTVDDVPLPLAAMASEFPARQAVRTGTGTMRIIAAAHLPAAGAGRHRITVVNAHRPQLSVYLANALVPANPRVRIETQERDRTQREFAVNYEVTGGPWSQAVWILGGPMILGLLIAGRRLRSKPNAHAKCPMLNECPIANAQ
jgi:hypothetical protein